MESTEVWYPLPQRKGDHSPRSRCSGLQADHGGVRVAALGVDQRREAEGDREDEDDAPRERRRREARGQKKAARPTEAGSVDGAALGASTLTGGVYY